jgi:5-aminolevulinate synthase
MKFTQSACTAPTAAASRNVKRLAHRIDIIEGTLGKAYGCRRRLHYREGRADRLRPQLFKSGFIFTTAFPPAVRSSRPDLDQAPEGIRR